jgi:hypothetical protein
LFARPKDEGIGTSMFPMSLLLLLQFSLFLVLGVILVAALKLLKQYQIFFPPAGARRVAFRHELGSVFDPEVLSPAMRESVALDNTLFLFLGRKCPICQPIKQALPSFVRDYYDIQFVIVGLTPTEMPSLSKFSSVIFTELQPLVRNLQIRMLPFALRLNKGRVVEFGVINSADHLESILAPESFDFVDESIAEYAGNLD